MSKQLQDAKTTKTESANPAADQPSITYAEVMEAVNHAPGLTDGVRQNVRGAVTKCAGLMSKAGLTQLIDIPKIAQRLDRLSPKRMGFEHRGSKSAFESNLRRALRLAGFTIMPGRHETPLAAPWVAFRDMITDEGLQRDLTRFFHVASAQGWQPFDISDAHIERLKTILRATCLKSKAEKTVRRTVRAWNIASASFEGRPLQVLRAGDRSDWTYVLAWSAFPASYAEDVAAFVDRGVSQATIGDWLDREDDRDPLRPRTKSNYSNALRRAASVLVKLGVEANSIRLVSDVVEPSRVKQVLHFLRDRTGREWGGHVGYMALVLYMAAVDRGGLDTPSLTQLGKWVDATGEQRRRMSERTEKRLTQFDDSAALARFRELPASLIASVAKLPLSVSTAKTVKMALLISLTFDTGLRSGNTVSLDLDRHFLGDIDSAKNRVFVVVPGDEIKNGVECRAPLRAATIKILKLYRDKHRTAYAGKACSWLFPTGEGGHMSQHQFYTDLKDLADRELGLDVTPHLIRALIAKIILSEYPGGMPIVQQMLGHTNLATPTAYYASLHQQDAAGIYHDILEGRAVARGGDLI